MGYNGSDKYHGPSRNADTETLSPGNGSDATVSEDTEVVLINPDGTNSVVPDNAAKEGRRLTVVHNGGSNTPTLSFADSKFVGTGPANLTSEGATETIVNTDGTNSGWVQAGSGSA